MKMTTVKFLVMYIVVEEPRFAFISLFVCTVICLALIVFLVHRIYWLAMHNLTVNEHLKLQKIKEHMTYGKMVIRDLLEDAKKDKPKKGSKLLERLAVDGEEMPYEKGARIERL